MYHYTDGGLRNVWLAKGYEITPPPLVKAWLFTTLMDSPTQAEGNEPIAKAVERIKTVERLVKQRIVVKESLGQWKPSLQDEEAVTH